MAERNDERTPCQRKGYKVGDTFEIISNESFGWKKGDLCELDYDDGSIMPGFRNLDKEYEEQDLKYLFQYLDNVKKLGDFH